MPNEFYGGYRMDKKLCLKWKYYGGLRWLAFGLYIGPGHVSVFGLHIEIARVVLFDLQVNSSWDISLMLPGIYIYHDLYKGGTA